MKYPGYIRDHLRPDQDPLYGDQRASVEPGGGGFQTGYLMRALVDFLEEIRDRDPQAFAEGFSYLSGLVEWNRLYGNFAYYFDVRAGGAGVSDGSGLTLVDPQAWYYWHTGRGEYWTHLQLYLTNGINGGTGPYGDFNRWTGQFEGRCYLFVKTASRPDTNPPPAASEVQAVPGGGRVLLKWRAPADAARYQIVWADRPITAQSGTNPATVNWWAAQAAGPSLAPRPGAMQRVVIDPGTNAPIYAALFAFDAAWNLGPMSSNTTTLGVAPDTQPPVIALPGPVVRWPVPIGATNGSSVPFTVTATDVIDPDPSLVCFPPAGSLFRPGTTTVYCTATDFAGNTTVTQFVVWVSEVELGIVGVVRQDSAIRLDLLTSTTGRPHHVERTEAVTTGLWQSVLTFWPASVGVTNWYDHPGTEWQALFYRLRMESGGR